LNSAIKWLNENGFDLGDTGAAKLRVTTQLPDEQVRVSFDHIVEKASDPTQALDASNLRQEFHDPNSSRETIQMRHRELRAGQPALPPAA
jgi:hypothetical protein